MGKRDAEITTESAAVEVTAKKRYLVFVQGNQAVEFVVAGKEYRAEPGVALTLDEDVVKHPHFQAQAQRFGIREA